MHISPRPARSTTCWCCSPIGSAHISQRSSAPRRRAGRPGPARARRAGSTRSCAHRPRDRQRTTPSVTSSGTGSRWSSVPSSPRPARRTSKCAAHAGQRSTASPARPPSRRSTAPPARLAPAHRAAVAVGEEVRANPHAHDGQSPDRERAGLPRGQAAESVDGRPRLRPRRSSSRERSAAPGSPAPPAGRGLLHFDAADLGGGVPDRGLDREGQGDRGRGAAVAAAQHAQRISPSSVEADSSTSPPCEPR